MWISNSTAIAQVITCGDVMAEISNTAKDLLHKSAQERAQADYEAFMEKKLETPYIGWPDKGTPESMAATIELYWCETRNTPLHTAYYSPDQIPFLLSRASSC